MNTNKDTHNDQVTLSGDWTAQSKELQAKYPQLTDEDLKLEEGREQDLITRVQTRLDKKRPEVVELLRAGQIEKQ